MEVRQFLIHVNIKTKHAKWNTFITLTVLKYKTYVLSQLFSQPSSARREDNCCFSLPSSLRNYMERFKRQHFHSRSRAFSNAHAQIASRAEMFVRVLFTLELRNISCEKARLCQLFCCTRSNGGLESTEMSPPSI